VYTASVPKNANAAPIRVVHANLKRWDPDSAYRSHCPVCEQGVLLVYRDPDTLKLVRTDHCISCLQTVIYTDSGINGESFTDPI
jgi:hypothetical protein